MSGQQVRREMKISNTKVSTNALLVNAAAVILAGTNFTNLSAAEVLYSNVASPTNEFLSLRNDVEFGDQANFSPFLDARTITGFQFETFGDNLTQDTTAVLRFYNADSATTMGVGALRLQTMPFIIDPGYQTHSISGFSLDLDGMNSIIWTVTIEGIPQDGTVGLTLADPPSTGSSLNDYFENLSPGDPGQFVIKQFSDSQNVNFTAILEGEATAIVVPEPATAALGALGLGALLLRRSRRSH